MDLHPPIEKRTTEQLLEIVEAKDQWQEEAVRLAQNELVRRGFPLAVQENRRKSKTKFNERIQSIKGRASYTTIEKILIVLFGPILMIVFHDVFMFQPGEGYKKKNRQGLFYLLLGAGLWFWVLTNI